MLLHVCGNINIVNKNCIAIVGTRKPAEYGVYAAKKLAHFSQKINMLWLVVYQTVLM